MILSRHPRAARTGLAAVYVLVVLSVLSVFSVAAVGQLAAARHAVEAHRNGLQAEWLVRAGCELAVAKLLADADKYTGETVVLLPGSEVKIELSKDPAKKGVYQIESRARYRMDTLTPVVRVRSRTLTTDPRAFSKNRTDKTDGTDRTLYKSYPSYPFYQPHAWYNIRSPNLLDLRA